MADLLETAQDGVAIPTLNRPEARNALSNAMLDGLLKCLGIVNRVVDAKEPKAETMLLAKRFASGPRTRLAS